MNKHVNYSIIKVFFNENGQWDKQVVFLVFYLPRVLTLMEIDVDYCPTSYLGYIFLPVCYSSLALFDLYWRF